MSSKTFWIAFGVGVAAGATIALLTAPQRGKRTRKQLLKGVGDAGEYLHQASEYLREQAERLSVEAQSAFRNGVKEATPMVRKYADRAQEAVNSAADYVQKNSPKVVDYVQGNVSKASRMM